MTAAVTVGVTAGATVDARGLRCPWPVLRLAKAMRTHDAATIVADDPAAPEEIAALAAAHGWTLIRNEDEFGASIASGNASFTVRV